MFHTEKSTVTPILHLWDRQPGSGLDPVQREIWRKSSLLTQEGAKDSCCEGLPRRMGIEGLLDRKSGPTERRYTSLRTIYVSDCEVTTSHMEEIVTNRNEDR